MHYLRAFRHQDSGVLSRARKERSKACLDDLQSSLRFFTLGGATEPFDQRAGPSEKQVAEEQATYREAAETTMVLLPKAQNRALLSQREADGVFFRGTDTAVMDGLNIRIEDHAPTRFPAADAPIHVFGINEEALIEQTKLVDGLPPDEPKTANEHVHIDDAVALEVEHVLAAEESRGREQCGQADGRAEVIPESWEFPARALVSHIAVENPRPDHTNIGVSLHVINQGIDAIANDLDI